MAVASESLLDEFIFEKTIFLLSESGVPHDFKPCKTTKPAGFPGFCTQNFNFCTNTMKFDLGFSPDCGNHPGGPNERKGGAVIIRPPAQPKWRCCYDDDVQEEEEEGEEGQGGEGRNNVIRITAAVTLVACNIDGREVNIVTLCSCIVNML